VTCFRDALTEDERLHAIAKFHAISEAPERDIFAEDPACGSSRPEAATVRRQKQPALETTREVGSGLFAEDEDEHSYLVPEDEQEQARASDSPPEREREERRGARVVDRLKLAVAGLASGVVCGIAGGLSVCALGGMVLPKLDPDFSQLASVDVFVRIAFGLALAGVIAGLVGPRPFHVFSGLTAAGPLSLLFGMGGLFVGAFGGPLIRLALGGLGFDAGGGDHVIEHDIRVGCGVGMIAGPVAAVRLLLWPPSWMWWGR
jgi:nitroreductase